MTELWRARLRATVVLLAGSALLSTLPALAAAQSPEAPPPTPVPVPGGGTSPSPFPSVLRTPEPSPGPPVLRAAAVVLADLDTGQVLFALNPRERRPVASLTKIMTALLVLRRSDLADVVVVSETAADGYRNVGISELGLVPGERIRVEQLLYALLLQSANDAALALAEHVSGSVERFVLAMNAKGRHLGLGHTRFASPNGLDDVGYSSARDLAKLTRAAYAAPGFGDVVAARFHEVPPPAVGGEPRFVQNRNALLWLYPGAIGVKTGFTSAAGFNVVAAAEREGVRLVAVVLGEPGEPFSDAAALLDYGFAAFERRELLFLGEPLGSVAIGSRRVSVAAGAGLAGLVPVEADVARMIAVDPGVRFPPSLGEEVGTVTLSAPGLRVGRVSLVVTGVPGPPPLEQPGPWWRRALSAVVESIFGLLSGLFG